MFIDMGGMMMIELTAISVGQDFPSLRCIVTEQQQRARLDAS